VTFGTRGGQKQSFWLRRSAFPERFATAEAWHDEARRLLAPLLPADGPSINRRLRRNGELEKVLLVAPASGHPARTIHSVKGMEFPEICVVMSPSTAKGIIDSLAGAAAGDNEEARKIYVGASRARLAWRGYCRAALHSFASARLRPISR
jgi:DNA helicase-2/ATP-dependent DNA helicase PcrA